MEEQENVGQGKKGLSKRLITTIVIALLVIGGGVAAFIALNNANTTKAEYFKAEIATNDFISEKFKERFEPELKWVELTEKNPTESKIELSAEYNDPFGGSDDMFSAEQIINNASLSITSQTDMKEKKIATEIAAGIAGIPVDDIKLNLYLTDKNITIGLPFLNELLQISDENIEKLIKEEALEDITIDFNQIFDQSYAFFSEEDKEYFNKEYIQMIYDALPEDAFKSSKEKVDSINTEKIEFHLTENEVKDVLALVFTKLEKDERVKELFKDQFTNQLMGLNSEDVFSESEFDQLMTEFEDGISIAKEGLKDFQIPNGLTSTIWVDKDLIVKRELSVEMGPTDNDLIKFTINGTQVFEDDSQTFTYDLGYEDAYDEGNLVFSGDLSSKGDQIKDSIKLVVEGIELSYEAEETLKKGKRDFNRTISLIDPFSGGGSLLWSGNSTYEKDNMSSEHDFSIDVEGIEQDLFTLHLGIDGKKIKSVDIPEENIRDVGAMSMDEITDYIETDVTQQFQKWIMGIMIDSGEDFGF